MIEMGDTEGDVGARAEDSTSESRVAAALKNAFGGHDPHLDDPALSNIAAGELLCDVGDEADVAWVLVSGRLSVDAVDDDGNATTIDLVGPGELIGEAALLEGGRRRARIRAIRRSQVVVLDQDWLNDLLSEHPRAALQLVRTVTERSARSGTPRSNIMAVIPLTRAVADEARRVAEVASEYSGFPMVDAPTASASPTNGDRATDWLEEHEEQYGGAVLVADPADEEWTIATAELADRLMFVVDAGNGPEISETEHRVLRSVPKSANASRTLLIVHPADTTRPRGTREWLERREVDLHLHLRRSEPAHRARAARHLVGRPLALAIGAGGVRSAGAVGTIRSLTERGVAVDAAGGVSGGAIIAAWLAMSDDSLEDLEDRTEWSMHKLLDFTIPVGSVVAGRRAWKRIQEAVGDRDVTDTWLPLTIVSTDLTGGRSVAHRQGPLADILYASISIPGVFPPVDIDGHLHVDGALFEAIPVEGIRELVPGARLVAVDLAPPQGRPTTPLPRVMRGGRLLARKLVPGMSSTSIPNPLDTLMRSTTVASAQRREEAVATVDCHVHLNLSEFSVLEFDQVRRVVELGEAKSNEIIEAFVNGDDPPLLDPTLVEAASRPPVESKPLTDDETSLTMASIAASLSLAWSDLRFRVRRFAVAGLASSVVLALLLQMTGVVNQLHREPREAVDRFGGSHWIVPTDVDGAFTSNATFPESLVAGAEGGRVLLARYRLADDQGNNDLDAILIGHEDLPDGAPELSDGRLADNASEVVLADAADFSVGDEVQVGTTPATVVGIVDDASVFAGMPLVFVPLETARALVVGGEPLISALVVDDVPDLPAELQALEASAVADDALGPVERPVTTLRLVQILLAVVATLIIGAVVFLATLDRLRDIAVMRAMGVKSSVISLGVVVQSVGVGAVAGVFAVIIQLFLAPVFPLDIHLGTTDRVLLVGVAIVVAAAASYGAIRRTLRIDPSQAFAGPGG